MRFRFLGGMDCPDWLLSQIAASSKLSALKYRGLCQLAVDKELGKEIPESSISKYLTDEIDIKELQRILMSLNFIFKKSSGYSCAPEDLENELVQLGLPPEHSKMISKIFTASKEAIKEKLLEEIVKEPEFHVQSIKSGNNQSEIIIAGKFGEKEKAYAFPTAVYQQFCQEMKKIDKILEEKF